MTDPEIVYSILTQHRTDLAEFGSLLLAHLDQA